MRELEPVYLKIGRWVRRRRKEHGFTQEELGALFGLCSSSITQIEAGQQRLPIHTLTAMAELFGYSLTLRRRTTR